MYRYVCIPSSIISVVVTAYDSKSTRPGLNPDSGKIIQYTMRFRSLHRSTLHYITLHYITLHYITLHYITLHYITLHYITLHYITLHYITLHYITLHYITLHYLHYITLQSSQSYSDS